MNQTTPSQRQAEDELRKAFQELGLWPLQFDDSEEGPEIDTESLNRLRQGKLPKTQATLLLKLVARYEPWYRAYLDLASRPD